MSTVELESPAALEAAEGDEFEHAFAEFAAAQDGEAEAVVDAPDQEDPAHDPAQAEPPEREASEPAPPTIEALTAELEQARQAASDFEHRFRSEVGRQAAYQRQISELKAQIQSTPNPTSAQQRTLSERMTKIADDFPELAQAFQEELEEAIGAVRQELDQNLQPIRQREQEAYLQMEERRVAEAYPDFQNVVRSTEFQAWFSEQPEAVRSLAASPLAQDAIAVLDYYTGGQRFRQEPNAQVQQVQSRRQAAMERNTSVRTSAPAPVADAPDDFESAFNYYAKRLGK